jgi:YggT family protein
MTSGASFWAHWYYHVPDLIMAALIWLLIARIALAVALGPGPGNTGVRLLHGITDPVLLGIGAITPRLVPAGLVVVCAIVWLLAARIALFVAVSATGARL